MNLDEKRLSAGQLAQVACLLEATARKPGNVHRFRDFDETHYLDFLLSAAAIAGPLDRASEQGLGRTILDCVEATRRFVRTNTNLGMILLLAPMAAVPLGEDLETGLVRILGSTSVDDARLVYQAIQLARPGGLGKVADQDVRDEPTITLREAMVLAADRDLIARQYQSNFSDVLKFAVPILSLHLKRDWSIETAIIDTFLTLLANNPDTLIARKRGEIVAREASSRATKVHDDGWPMTPEGRASIAELDEWLRADGHARNPGATADLTTAALFAALRDGTITLPIAGNWSSSGIVDR